MSRVRQRPVREPVSRPGSCTKVSEAADGRRGEGIFRRAGDAGDEEDGCERVGTTRDDCAGPRVPMWLLLEHPARVK